MRHAGSRWILAVLIGAALAGAGHAAEPEYAFGGGGPGLGLFMPDLTEINAFVEGAGFTPFDGHLSLVGGGGRGGLVPGMAFGGAGWGAWIESEETDSHAEYGVGLGGFDVGMAVGGSMRSVLMLGALFGGGASELILTEFSPISDAGFTPRGIVVEPAQHTYDCVFGLVAPYIDMQVQLLDWMGVAIRAGYVWVPFEIHGANEGPLDAPDLAPSGLYVRLTLRFGAITGLEPEAVPGEGIQGP